MEHLAGEVENPWEFHEKSKGKTIEPLKLYTLCLMLYEGLKEQPFMKSMQEII